MVKGIWISIIFWTLLFEYSNHSNWSLEYDPIVVFLSLDYLYTINSFFYFVLNIYRFFLSILFFIILIIGILFLVAMNVYFVRSLCDLSHKNVREQPSPISFRVLIDRSFLRTTSIYYTFSETAISRIRRLCSVSFQSSVVFSPNKSLV